MRVPYRVAGWFYHPDVRDRVNAWTAFLDTYSARHVDGMVRVAFERAFTQQWLGGVDDSAVFCC